MRSGLALIGILFFSYSCSHLPDGYVDLHSGRMMSIRDMLRGIDERRVIFIGEGHTVMRDHLIQLEIIKHLTNEGKKVSIAMEMFPGTLQPVLNSWINGDIEEGIFRDAYLYTWNVPYENYRRIFDYARANGIPLVGINADPIYIKFLKIHGVERLSAKTRKLLRFTSCSEEDSYTKSMQTFWGELNHKSDFTTICNMRRFREAVMAFNLAEYLEKNDHTVVVILGAFHAVRTAVPEILKRHGSYGETVLIPASLAHLTGDKISPKLADFTW